MSCRRRLGPRGREPASTNTQRTAARVNPTSCSERLAKEGIRWAPDEMINLRADLLVTQAEVMSLGGDELGAEGARAGAAQLYERKGNLAAAASVAHLTAR